MGLIFLPRLLVIALASLLYLYLVAWLAVNLAISETEPIGNKIAFDFSKCLLW